MELNVLLAPLAPPLLPAAAVRLAADSRSRSASASAAQAAAQAADASSPRPLPRARSRRALKRYLQDHFVAAPWAAAFWAGLSDEELAFRLEHMTVAPPGGGPRAGIRELFAPGRGDVLDEFRRGAFGCDASAIGSDGGGGASATTAALEAGRLTAAAFLQRLWARVPVPLRPLLLRECRRAHRLAAAEPRADAARLLTLSRSLVAEGERLCLALLDGSLLQRLRAGAAAAAAGAADFAPDSELGAALERPLALCMLPAPAPYASAASASAAAEAEPATAEGVLLVFADGGGGCVSLLRGICAFYGLRCVEGSGDGAASLVCLRIALMPARSRGTRLERAATALLRRQLATAAAEASAAAAASAVDEAAGAQAAGGVGGALPAADSDGASGTEAAADALGAQVAEAEVLMVSLFVRTVTDQTRAKFDGLSAGACAGPDGSFGPLRKAPRFVRRAMPKASDAASADADPR